MSIIDRLHEQRKIELAKEILESYGYVIKKKDTIKKVNRKITESEKPIKEGYIGDGYITDDARDYFADGEDTIEYIGSDGSVYTHDANYYKIEFSDGYSDIVPKEYIEIEESIEESVLSDVVSQFKSKYPQLHLHVTHRGGLGSIEINDIPKDLVDRVHKFAEYLVKKNNGEIEYKNDPKNTSSYLSIMFRDQENESKKPIEEAQAGDRLSITFDNTSKAPNEQEFDDIIRQIDYEYYISPLHDDTPLAWDADISFEGNQVILTGYLGPGLASSGSCTIKVPMDKFNQFYELNLNIPEDVNIEDFLDKYGWGYDLV